MVLDHAPIAKIAVLSSDVRVTLRRTALPAKSGHNAALGRGPVLLKICDPACAVSVDFKIGQYGAYACSDRFSCRISVKFF